MEENVKLRWITGNIRHEKEVSKEELKEITNIVLINRASLVYVNFDRNRKERKNKVWIESKQKEKRLLIKNKHYYKLIRYCES